MIMKEDFVSYDIAVKLKEKGFKEKCYAYYFPKGSELIFNHNPFRGGIIEDCLYSNNSLPNECMASDFIDAPTISQVLKWLRKEKKIYCLPYFEQGVDMWLYAICRPLCGCEYPKVISQSIYDTYEQAAIAGVNYCLENLI